MCLLAFFRFSALINKEKKFGFWPQLFFVKLQHRILVKNVDSHPYYTDLDSALSLNFTSLYLFLYL